MLRFSRRNVLAAGTAMAAVPFALWRSRASAAGYAGAGVHVRHDAASAEGQAMLAKLARAVTLMRARPAGDPLSWTFQWYIHWIPDNTTKADELAKLDEPQRALAKELWNTCRAHDKHMDESLFLPWHRAYVFFFERIIRKVLDDEDFALPYWDLTDPDKRALPAAFLNPADASNALYSPNRKAEVNSGQPIDYQHGAHSPLNADAIDQEEYAASDVTQGLCMALDKGVHASVHVLIGNMHGMGAVQWAANDPIFWMLHTDMDRLWVSWAAGGHANPANDEWLDTEFVFADENGQRVAMQVRDFLDAEQLGYRYDRLLGTAVIAGASAPEAGGGQAEPGAAPPHRARHGGNRAAPPGAVAAAPPPPVIVAQAAPAQPAQAMQSHGPVHVGQNPVQVTLASPPVRVGAAAPAPAEAAPQTTTAAPSGGSERDNAAPAPPPPPAVKAQAPRPSKLYIVIRNLQAKAQPGVLYDVFVKVTTSGGEMATARLGSINFFDAVDHAAMPGMTMQQSFVSFEVTSTLALARAAGAKLDVTIAPVGQPATNASPVIGNISLVEKPA